MITNTPMSRCILTSSSAGRGEVSGLEAQLIAWKSAAELREVNLLEGAWPLLDRAVEKLDL